MHSCRPAKVASFQSKRTLQPAPNFFFEQAVSGKTCYLNKVDAESANCTGSCTC